MKPMEKIEIKYNRGKLVRAIGIVGIALVAATFIVFFTDIFVSQEALRIINIPAKLLVLTADFYLIFTIYKKRRRFSGVPAITLTPESIDVDEDGKRSKFKWTDIVKIEVTKKQIGESHIDVLVISDKTQNLEINLSPLEKDANEFKKLITKYRK
jgi:hypothetical protein